MPHGLFVPEASDLIEIVCQPETASVEAGIPDMLIPPRQSAIAALSVMASARSSGHVPAGEQSRTPPRALPGATGFQPLSTARMQRGREETPSVSHVPRCLVAIKC